MSDTSFPSDQDPRTENSADIEGVPTFSGHDVLDDQNQYVGKVTDVICASTPEPFQAVGLWYEQFDQTSDDEVIELLRRSAATRLPATPVPSRP